MAPKQRVLIVEDNADLRRLYAIGLNQHGFEVKLAGNGAEALDRIATDPPDLILVDLLMPVMDGWELISKVNPPEQNAFIPVIVITGHPLPTDRSLPSSIVGWLGKPAAIEDIVGMINQRTRALSPAPPQLTANRQTSP